MSDKRRVTNWEPVAFGLGWFFALLGLGGFCVGVGACSYLDKRDPRAPSVSIVTDTKIVP